MRIVDIRDAKKDFARLIAEAARGEPFVIAKAGRPMVQVAAASGRPPGHGRLGFLRGQLLVPDDFDRMGEREIERSFQSNIK